ncbi:MAG: FG-GAP-like repeat-containing protein [Candidatus Paceibacterota bacterium]
MKLNSVIVFPCILFLIFFFIFRSDTDLFAFAPGGDPHFNDQRSIAVSPLNSRFSSNTFTGSFDYTYELLVPPGRNGFHPDIVFSYSSQKQNNQNIVGYGWDINIPYIERLNIKGVNILYDEEFTSTIDGELRSISSSTQEYSARFEQGSFNRYEYSTSSDSHWIMSDNRGVRYYFGLSTSSQIFDESTTTQRVYRWMLEKIQDQNGNSIDYEYLSVKGVPYISRILYTNHPDQVGIFEINFSYTSRADISTSTISSFPIVSNKLLSQVEILVNDTWVSKYDFLYSTGENSKRSLLSSITRSGKDDLGNILSLPSNTFQYGTLASSTKTWIQDSNYSVPVDFMVNTSEQGVRLADVNADGLIDIVRSNSSNDDVWINKGDGTGWAENTEYEIPVSFAQNGNDEGVHLVDVNGDLYPDIVKSVLTGGASYQKVYMNNKDDTGWTVDNNYEIPTLFIESGEAYGIAMVDINGDGLVDIVRADSGANAVYINDGDGTGWTHDSSLTVPTSLINGGSNTGARFVDINADGLVDLIKSDGENPEIVWLNIDGGKTWTVQGNASIPTSIVVSGLDKGSRFIDVNGDGLVDQVRGDAGSFYDIRRVYINNGDGTGWSQDSEYYLPLEFVNGSNDQGVQFADVDGDGHADIIQSVNRGGVYRKVFINQGKTTDVLTSVNTETGAIVAIDYKTSVEEHDSQNKLLNPRLPLTIHLVKHATTTDGLGLSQAESYIYSGGSFYYGDERNRWFGGFSTTTTNDGLTKTVQYYHQGNTTASALGEYFDHHSKIGKVFRAETYDISDNLFSTKINKWESKDLSQGRYFIHQTRSTELLYNGQNKHVGSAKEYTFSSSNGNLIQSIDYGIVNASGDGSFIDVGSDRASTTVSYSASTSASAFISREVTDSQTALNFSDIKYYYDNLSFGSVNKGNVTKVENLILGSSYASSTKSYDLLGNIISERDPLGNETSYSYDNVEMYISTTTNELEHIATFEYDYSSGKQRMKRDENGYIFETVFDALDRVSQEKQPDVIMPQNLVISKQYAYTVSSTPPLITHVTFYLNSATTTNKYVYFDGLNRKIQERIESENSNIYSTKEYLYNSFGLLRKESLPYFSSGTAYTNPTSTDAMFTEYEYDALKRITLMSTVTGDTTNTYNGFGYLTIDAEGNKKFYEKDATNNLTAVGEYLTYSVSTTSYNYDIKGNLTKITDADGNIRTFTYDGLSRRLTATDLHDISDGTYGTTTYTYDDAGNITQVVDPNSNIVNRTYDDLNRFLTEDYTGNSGTEITLGYDWCTNGVGKLCSATTTDTVKVFSYTPLHLQTETVLIDGDTYTTGFTHDRQGNYTSITHPDGSVVAYVYNNAGLLESLNVTPSGTTTAQSVVENFDYSPTGQVTFKRFGNGVESTYTFDANELYRLKNIYTEKTTGTGGAGEELMAYEQLLFNESQPLGVRTLDPFTPDASMVVGVEDVGSMIFKQIHEEDNDINPYITFANYFETEKDGVRAVFSRTFPFMELSRWGGEVVLGVLYEGVNEKGQRKFRTNVLEWSGDRETVVAFPVDASKDAGIGGFEFELILHEKPQTNQFNFTLTGTEDLDFFYQPSLFEEYGFNIVSKTCTETECDTDQDGEIDTYRPKHIVGSYAVYHKEKVGYVEGKKDYGTGKLFHIYRPKIIDVDGKTVWGTLTYDNSVLTVVVPQDFLDTATYPVAVDPTFGYETAGGTTVDLNSNEVRVSSSTVPIDMDTVEKLTLYVSDPGGYFKGIIYKLDDTFEANGLGAEVSPIGWGGGWVDTAFSIEPSLASGTVYYLGGIGGASKSRMYYDSGVTNQAKYDDSISYTSPSSLTSPIHDARKYSVYATYSTTTGGGGNTAPSAPSSLLTEGQTNPTAITDSTPEFSAIYVDADTGDIADYYQIQVSTDSSFGSTHWDSTKTALASSTPEGARIADITYSGSALASSTTYYWRIKFFDTADAEGAWSTATSTFSLSTSTGGGSPSNGYILQNISYTYDNVGNITTLTDHGDTGAGKTVVYTYDNLYRLTLASTTIASSTPFSRSYSYTPLGNITASTHNGSYTYGETGYANPHAPTTIGSTTLTYDNNGNLLTYGDTTHTWNYNNTLASTENGISTSTYAYDHTNLRIRKEVDGITTYYPHRSYTTGDNGTSIHIYDSTGTLLAEVAGNTQTSGSSVPPIDAYTDAIGDDFADWSWSTTRDFASTEEVFEDTHSLKVTYTSSWGGLYFYGDTPMDVTNYNQLSFAFHGSSTGGQNISVRVTDSQNNELTPVDMNDYITGGSPSSNTWYEVAIPFSAFGATSTIQSILFHSPNTTTIYLDNVQLTNSATSTSTASSTLHFIHTDHLGGTNVTTNSEGEVVQVLDYYPFGGTRIDDTTSVDVTKKFTGHEFDRQSNLTYANARYYNQMTGRFLSQDPVHHWIGDTEAFKSRGLNFASFLANPQNFNSYSYALNNPLRYTDPNGELPIVAVALVLAQLYSAVLDLQSAVNTLQSEQSVGQKTGSLLFLGAQQFNPMKKVEAVNVAKDAVGNVVQRVNKIHGNSLESTKLNTGYTLRDAEGSVLKYGETTRPGQRYSQKFLDENGYIFRQEVTGTKRDIHFWQHNQILDYKVQFGIRPLLNKSDW